MYNTLIISKIYELKELITSSKEFSDIKEKEKNMEEKSGMLLIKYQRLIDEYNNALRFSKYGSNVEIAKKELYECKNELDHDENIKSYKQAYKTMKLLLKGIEEQLFSGIIEYKNI